MGRYKTTYWYTMKSIFIVCFTFLSFADANHIRDASGANGKGHQYGTTFYPGWEDDYYSRKPQKKAVHSLNDLVNEAEVRFPYPDGYTEVRMAVFDPPITKAESIKKILEEEMDKFLLVESTTTELIEGGDVAELNIWGIRKNGDETYRGDWDITGGFTWDKTRGPAVNVGVK